MIKEELRLPRCLKNQPKFIKGNEYILMNIESDMTYKKNGNTYHCYEIINEEGVIEKVFREDFDLTKDRTMSSIKNVVFLGIGNIKSLIRFEKYSVFKVKEEGSKIEYLVFDENNKLKWYPDQIFIDVREFNLLSEKNTLEKYLEDNKEYILKIFNEYLAKKDRMIEEEKEKKRRENEKAAAKILREQKEKEDEKRIKLETKYQKENAVEVIYSLRKSSVRLEEKTFITENKFIETITTLMKKKNFAFYFILSYLMVTTVCSFFVPTYYFYASTGLLCFFVLGANHFLSNIIKEVKEIPPLYVVDKWSKANVDILECLNDNILLKLKKIEIALVSIHKKFGVSESSIDTIRQSVDFCLESYKLKNEKLQEDIEAFLDQTLEYINSLKENSSFEQTIVELQVYKNISAIIERNKEAYKVMTETNKQVREVLEKQTAK